MAKKPKKQKWDWEEDNDTVTSEEDSDQPAVKDSNGTPLANGDSVLLIKDLKVKGAGQTLKRGTVIKNIRLTSDPEEIDCRTSDIKGLVLRTEFVRKR
ncbi:alkylphosphonate utilization protein [Zymomonas mobilis]|uniref:PhnA protein n=1 Tax=Zymomonas mobilis subsp. mobilis (strain ATCC 10988 / DSM 424 / LMG 404 / NCIMB 8938 / NRRL B-806 / ZM1) TaxID=555217 RepID=A0A0H3G381_ZYMMA|nr:alkylphosphonate utilization protein [Zymomonas mobilis]AEH63134.1 PhnA protein [Zymomonas mobilis subsp. mobilis ATCC 10988]TQL27253.1 protein PhnA [Zymomonas mobilis]TQL28683.1 protein PhnA [Zymomonas mobilis]